MRVTVTDLYTRRVQELQGDEQQIEGQLVRLYPEHALEVAPEEGLVELIEHINRSVQAVDIEILPFDDMKKSAPGPSFPKLQRAPRYRQDGSIGTAGKYIDNRRQDTSLVEHGSRAHTNKLKLMHAGKFIDNAQFVRRNPGVYKDMQQEMVDKHLQPNIRGSFQHASTGVRDGMGMRADARQRFGIVTNLSTPDSQRGTMEHEQFHGTMSWVGEHHGPAARQNLGRHLYNSLPSQYRQHLDQVFNTLAGDSYKDSSVPHEEKLARLLNYVNSSTDRENFHRSMGRYNEQDFDAGPEGEAYQQAARQRYDTVMKRAYQAFRAAAGTAGPSWLDARDPWDKNPNHAHYQQSPRPGEKRVTNWVPQDDVTKSEELSKSVLDPGLGYQLSTQPLEDMNPGSAKPVTGLRVVAHDRQGRMAGEVQFQHVGRAGLKSFETYVQPEHRRLGLASAMYAHAEKQSGRKIKPSNDQTTGGKALWAANRQVQQFGKSEPLTKMTYPTSDATANRMRPHQARGYDSYARVDSYKLPNGYFHHQYHGWPISDDYHPVLDAISTSDNPLREADATSSNGVSSVARRFDDPYYAGKQNNMPWKEGMVTQVGESASHGPKGLGTILYEQMAKTHGRLMSDWGTSKGADGVWRKLTQNPEFKGQLGPEEGNVHWVEHQGLKPEPYRSIIGDGRSLENQVREPVSPYSVKIKQFPGDYFEAHVHHKDKPDERVGTLGMQADRAAGHLYPGAVSNFDYDHRDAGYIARIALHQHTGLRPQDFKPTKAESLPAAGSSPNLDKHEDMHGTMRSGEGRDGVLSAPQQGESGAIGDVRPMSSLLRSERDSSGGSRSGSGQEGGDQATRAPGFYQQVEGSALHGLRPQVFAGVHGLRSSTWRDEVESGLKDLGQWRQLGKAVGGSGQVRLGVQQLSSYSHRDEEPVDRESVIDQHGFMPHLHSSFLAAQFLSGKTKVVPLDKMRRLLYHHDSDHEAAALAAHGLQVTDENRAALAHVRKLQGLSKKESAPPLGAITPGVAEAGETAHDVSLADAHDDVEPITLDGKHSKGSMLARGTMSTWLLKPGSGGQSPAAGDKDISASQSKREAAFWHLADAWELGDDIPHTDLLSIGGEEFAAIEMLPFTWKNASKVQLKAPNRVLKALGKYREAGRLHMWAILDFVAGNPDRHGANVMMSPEDELRLIDHGSCFAGQHFDPAHDKNSFVPFYLRAWVAPGKFLRMPVAEKLTYMPTVSHTIREELRQWVDRLDPQVTAQVLLHYAVDPAATLSRLARVKALKGDLDQAVNQLWVTV